MDHLRLPKRYYGSGVETEKGNGKRKGKLAFEEIFK
jgi:hypothetical protein